ncbi:Protein of unknown function [Pseudidiomarina planktonica]|uniref:DUF2971 domain-containing protein n=1 Tax=Pseudidiomarina planktonica TaxID=1323738 RepID=A0A1Y6FXI8_9GAMM|nr:DUF2971 domain-containing protein [Pseudidiomarina planktonica]RUO63249.1 DUF2971 domain-containing protein [Pseudidiomarina planktonica]SMQ80536.1 Protein of unknown function [Pseudidiomarina planktonica]
MKKISRFLNLLKVVDNRPDFSYVENLISGQLFFRAPRELNDPFEVLPIFDDEGLLSATDPDLITVHKKMLALTYGYSPLEAEIELLRRISLSGLQQYNDYHRKRLKTAYFDLMTERMENHGVCCFVDSAKSQNPQDDEKLMWSLYANGVSGVKVEFDQERLVDSLDTSGLSTSEKYDELIVARDHITYQDNRPVIDVWDFFWSLSFTSDDLARQKLMEEKVISPYLFTKSKSWDRENEFRIVVEGAANKLVPFSVDSIESISFGQRCDAEVRARLHEAFRDKTKLYDVKTCEKTYDLCAIPLN